MRGYFFPSALHNPGAGRHVFGHPDVAAYHGSAAHGDASQDGGVAVHNHVVFQNGVARYAFDGFPVGIKWKALGAEGDALVQFHVVTDDACLADDHARAVVYGEVAAYLGAGMDVNARFAVCHFGDDAGNEGYAQPQQFVGDAVVADGPYGGIAADDLAERMGGRVAVVGRFDIGGQGAAHGGQAAYEACGKQRGFFAAVAGLVAVAAAVVGKAQACQDLMVELPK